MKDVVVTYKVSYSNSNDSDEFPWAWNVPARDIKTIHFALRCYFVSKTTRCFWCSLYMKDVHANGGTNHHDLCQTLTTIFKVIKSDMPECTWTENDQLLDIADCPVFMWKKYTETPPILSNSATEITENNYPLINLQVTDYVTLFYICLVNTSSYIVQYSYQMIIHKHLHLLTYFKLVLGIQL
jgi:hypothetical protein